MRMWVKVAAAVTGAGLVLYLIHRARAAPPTPPPPKTETSMIVTEEPPSTGKQGDSFIFAGYLEDAEGNRLRGKTVQWFSDGGGAAKTTTNASGEWSWSIGLAGPYGSIIIHAEFPGDEVYLPSRTGDYPIEW